MTEISNVGNCVNNIVDDLSKIRQYIENEDYKQALEELRFLLSETHFDRRREIISDTLHCGSSFVGEVDGLSVALQEQNRHSIDSHLRHVMAYGAQTKLPEGDYKTSMRF